MIDPTIVALAAQLRTAHPVALDLKQVECVADAVYHESRGEPLAAQVAVASVVVNRGEPCAVIRAPRQFAYRKIKHRKRADDAAWRQAAEVAVLLKSGAVQRYDATHFHDVSQTPVWTARMTLIGQAGRMKFWKA